jgi:hypothetical protein
MKPNLSRFLIVMSLTAILTDRASSASFKDEVDFLKKHTEVIVLSDEKGLGEVALVPAWQGRVITSTAEGGVGRSFGWINHELIESGKMLPHMNGFGGEDRFWLGPEGGQFSIFFAKGTRFDFENWFTPAVIDTMPYKVMSKSRRQATFGAEFSVTNYSGTRFELAVQRQARLLNQAGAWEKLQLPADKELKLVAYETNNKITNTGKSAWKKETGLLSIWILGMYNPSPSTTIVVPLKSGLASELGPKVTSDYFGAVPSERLVVKENVIYFSGDGKYRSKIGLNPRRSKGVLGSYDAENRVLTIVQFDQPEGVTDYVNSLWKLQDNPYGGDAANSYNDGPATPGAKPMGPFYEIESSSPAAALAPGQSMSHFHRTFHLVGDESALDKVARNEFGVSLAEIKAGLKQ